MINQYVFGLVLALSSLALILAMYLSLDSIISEVHDFAWISRASLLLAMGLLWYLLANADRIFKSSLIDLLIHPRVLNQICWFYKEWNYEIYLTMFLIEFSVAISILESPSPIKIISQFLDISNICILIIPYLAKLRWGYINT